MGYSKEYITHKNLKHKANLWLDEIRDTSRNTDLRIDIDKAALLVIDMQRYFLDKDSPAFTPAGLVILSNVSRFIDAFRRHSRPIIYTQHAHEIGDEGLMKFWWDNVVLYVTSPLISIHNAIKPKEGDIVIRKHLYDAFLNTPLDEILKSIGIKQLIITGVKTNLCCETTARSAFMRDYLVFFPVDATAASREEMHLASLRNLSYGFAVVGLTGNFLPFLNEE